MKAKATQRSRAWTEKRSYLSDKSGVPFVNMILYLLLFAFAAASPHEDFNEWASKCVVRNSISIGPALGMRFGGFASRNLRKGEPYICVSQDCFIDHNAARLSPAIREAVYSYRPSHCVRSPSSTLASEAFAAFFSISTPTSSSNRISTPSLQTFRPLFSSPTSTSNCSATAAYWSTSVRQLTSHPKIAEETLRDRQMTRREYDDLRERVFSKRRDLFPKEAFSLKEWNWVA